jgi:hypothetical protein
MNRAPASSRLLPIAWRLSSLLLFVASGFSQVLDKQRALDAETWWDNRDWDWYKANIPFFECPDAAIVTTYYYRWELVTKHLTYGSPASGYSFTEFIDRPFWSGAYGAISCPAGHQLYEIRWLRDARYGRDYARYWFRTPGAEPRRYGCWLANGVRAVHAVHPDDAFAKDLLPDLKSNYEGWVKRHFVPEVGLFWQNGHDDGMEYNITSRQTKDTVRGGDGFRPGFNAYMYADALAIASFARLAGDDATAREYETKAAALKEKVEQLLWDSRREFFFPMSMRDETDRDGNIVRQHTLTYQSGKYAGSPHGREEHGYIPWQFNLPKPGYESAWKFLMDENYFKAAFGPTTVERQDPQFLLQKTCCWWSGQSWPYATAQTLKAMANVLQNYRQDVLTRADYAALFRTFALSHRKDGRPYLAEALHPDTGSFEGHDSYNHSEHYFHSSFNDLVITGLMGVKPREDDTLEIDPLAPREWSYFAIDELPYRGRQLAIVWDRDGSRYAQGPGLRVFADGKELASLNQLGKIVAKLPEARQAASPSSGANSLVRRINYAVNNDGDYYPRLAASFTAMGTLLDKVNDGNYWYTLHPPNRWTSAGSSNRRDWLSIDFGQPRRLDTLKLYFLDDGTNVVAPGDYALEEFVDGQWRTISGQQRNPARPTGHRANVVKFEPREITKLRATFSHAVGAVTGLTEIEAWGDGTLPYLSPPPPAGNLAMNSRGEPFPQASASFSDAQGGLPSKAIDGKISFQPNPMNRWTSYGSTNLSDWLEIDFGASKQFGRVELFLYDDGRGVRAPAAYDVQYFTNGQWQTIPGQQKSPVRPTGGTVNVATFPRISAAKVRIVFTHSGRARSGATELMIFDF